jgi:hypothetical protein
MMMPHCVTQEEIEPLKRGFLSALAAIADGRQRA